MELQSTPIIIILGIALVGLSQAAVSPENYWKESLPNSDMPRAIRNSLPHFAEWTENKGTSVNVGKGGVHVNTGKQGSGGTSVNVGPHKGVNVVTGKPYGGHTNVNVGPKSGVGVHTGKPNGGHTDVNVGPKSGVGVNTRKPHKGGAVVGVGKGGVIVKAGPKKKPVFVGVHPGPKPFQYRYTASEAQLHDDPTRALFFLEKDMKLGHSMNLHFTRSNNEATFLPNEESNSIPFSSKKLPLILDEFSIEPDSEEAQIVEETIKGCESKGLKGENKYCATSLESLVNYAKKTLGKNAKALSTEAQNINGKAQKYTITMVKKVAKDNDALVCHKQQYPYAVFYCHKINDTSAYALSLVGVNGSRAKAMAVCHKDTSAWNPKHLAFQVLNVKPGSVPICHFLPEDHIVWIRN